jgi:hypothetical protein
LFRASPAKEAEDDRMNARPKNIVPFVLRGLPPFDELDQRLMRKLRKLADRTGSTVEDLIYEGILEFVTKRQIEKALETKIIQLPARSTFADDTGVHLSR